MPFKRHNKAQNAISKLKEPEWIAQDQAAIDAKKEKFRRTQIVFTRKKRDLPTTDADDVREDPSETERLRKEIGHGANLDETNLEIIWIRDKETGKFSKYLVKKLGSIDSVISSELFRTVSAGRYFAKREVIIKDEEDGTCYTAIKFEHKIASERLVLIKTLTEKEQELTARKQELRKLNQQEPTARQQEPDTAKDKRKINLTQRIIVLRKEIKKTQERLNSLPIHEEEKTNIFLGNTKGGKDVFDELSFADLRTETGLDITTDEYFLMSYSYMLGASQVFGEADNNPSNYTFRTEDGKRIPGRFDLTMSANLHPQPFGRILYGKTEQFKKATREYIAANQYYENYVKFLEGKIPAQPQPIVIEDCSETYHNFITNDCVAIAKFLYALKQYNAEKIEDLPQLECHKDSSVLLKRFQAQYAKFKKGDYVLQYSYKEHKHKQYNDLSANDFFSDYSITENTRVRTYGCFQSLVFFCENIAGFKLNEEYKIPPMIKAANDYPKEVTSGTPSLNADGTLNPPPGTIWTKELLERQAEEAIRLQNLSLDENKDAIYQNLRNKIDAGGAEAEKTKKRFIAFMYGIQRTIDLSTDQQYLNDLQTIFAQAPNGQELFEQHKKFLLQNAAQATKQFDIFLKYYHEIKNQLKEQDFKAPLRKETTTLDQPEDKIKDFKNGKTITLPASYLKTAYKTLLNRVLTDRALFRKKINRYGPSKRVPFKLNPFAQTEIDDISLTKALVCEETIFSKSYPTSKTPPVKFDDTVPLFKRNLDQKKKEIHVNFGTKYSFGGNIFFSQQDERDEEKTRLSSSGIVLAFLQQRGENKSGKHFLDLSLGRYSKTSGQPILIQGQSFAETHGEFKLDELEMHFVRDRKRLTNYTDAAKHIFATAYAGFLLCGNKQPDAIIRCGIDKKSWVDPFTQMAMLILAANCASADLKESDKNHPGIDLRLTGNFLDHTDKDRKFEYFQKIIFPTVTTVLNSTKNIGNKITELVGICNNHDEGIQVANALSQAKADNTGVEYRNQSRSVSAVAQSRPSSAPNTATLEPKTVQLVKLSKDENLIAIQKDIDAIIDQTAAGNPAQKKCILILLDSLAEYGLKHLKNEGAEINIDSIMKGGGNAGFTAWKNKPDFLQVLLQQAIKHGETDIDFSDEKNMRYFAKLSSAIQINSQNRFSKPDGRHYQGSINAVEMARSWRIALLRNIDGPTFTKETTQQTR